MATYYLDLEGGNDSNDGTTFANRWKTFVGGPTTARIAPGDVVRIMASSAPRLIDTARSITKGSETLTLSTSIAAVISTCESAWTASANVTCTTSSTRRVGTYSASMAMATGFTGGKAAYVAASGDFSAYRYIGFLFRSSLSFTAGAAAAPEIRICSDAIGNTPVHTITVPPYPSASSWRFYVWDSGGSLTSSVGSIALYYPNGDPAAVTVLLDQIVAIKDVASGGVLPTEIILPDAALAWEANTVYAQNKIRRPTQLNRTGWCYKATTGGTSGSTEPSWPEVIGETVADGTVVWTCLYEEYPELVIKTMSGTDLTIENPNADQSNGLWPYSTDTFDWYARTPIEVTETIGPQDSGTAEAPIIYSGGWDRTSMSSLVDETWIRPIGTNVLAFSYNATEFYRLCLACAYSGAQYAVQQSNSFGNKYALGHIVGGFSNAIRLSGGGFGYGFSIDRVVAAHTGQGLYNTNMFLGDNVRRFAAVNTVGSGVYANYHGIVASRKGAMHDITVRYTATAVANSQNAGCINISNYRGYDITTRDFQFDAASNQVVLKNPIFGSANHVVLGSGAYSSLVQIDGYNGDPEDYRVITQQGTMLRNASVRHTASGYSQEIQLSTAVRHPSSVSIFDIAKIPAASGGRITISIWSRKSATNGHAILRVCADGRTGINGHYEVDITPSIIDTWEQFSLSVVPTRTGVLQVVVIPWMDSTGSTPSSIYLDDLSIA